MPPRRRQIRADQIGRGIGDDGSRPAVLHDPAAVDDDYRSASLRASSMSCVTKTMVLPVLAWIARSSSCSDRRVTGIRAPNSSSIEEQRRVGRKRAGDAHSAAVVHRQLVWKTPVGVDAASRPTRRTQLGDAGADPSPQASAAAVERSRCCRRRVQWGRGRPIG